MSNKVMIVDDDEYIRIAVRELMRSRGIEVVTADGARACIAEFERGFRGVVLMDVMMPELDGWDAIRMIKETGHQKDAIIVMLTAKDRPDAKMEGLQAQVTDYITKPFDSDELVAVVRDNMRYLENGGQA